MHDARIEPARLAVDTLEPRNLLGGGERGGRIGRQVQLVSVRGAPGAHTSLAALHGYGARRARGLLERRQNDLVGVGEAGLLAGESAHADPLLDAGAAVLDDAVLERPGLLVRELEVKIGEIHRVRQHLAEDVVDARVVEPARPQDELARQLEGIRRLCAAHRAAPPPSTR